MRIALKRFLSGGSFLVASLFAANSFNFLFNAYLGRVLSFEEFGLVTLVTTIWNLTNIPFGSLAAAVNYRVAFLLAHDGKQAAITFFRQIAKKTIMFMLLASFFWVISTPWIADYFHVPPSVLWIITPSFFAGALSFIIRGYFSGIFAFGIAGIIIGLDAFIRLFFGVSITASAYSSYAFAAIPLSVVVTLIISTIIYLGKQRSIRSNTIRYRFPRRFFVASLLSGLAITAFLFFDVMLAKHYLHPVEAGQYAFLSLVGKMVFFFGSILNSFVITYVARDEGAGRDTNRTFFRFLIGVIFLSFIAFLGVGVFGGVTVPLLFGEKAFAVVPYLAQYSFAIALYTITGYIVLYHLARKHYLFSVIALCMAGAVVLGIFISHQSIGHITNVLFIVSVINFFVTSLFHFLQRNGRFVLRNLVDLLDIFSPLEHQNRSKKGKKRILVMNWRDTRHVYAGGAEVYIHELAKRWVKAGHLVTIFCGNDSKSPRNEQIDGIQIIRRGGFYFVYFWAFIYYVTRFRGRYDVIIDCHNGIPFFTPLYAKERVICIVHHIHHEVFRTNLTPALAFVAQFLENRLMPLVYREIEFVAVSESTRQDMIRWGIVGKGITIINNGIDKDVYTPGVKSKYPLIVYIGRLKYYKSINIFIRAAVEVRKRFPKSHFVIAGEGEEKKRLVELARKLNASSFIEFRGKITQQEKVDLYQKSWVFVNPSRMEGWGITTIEANACATPVVASRVPGLSDSVADGKSGILVPYGDAQAFSDAICALLKFSRIRKAMEKNALEWSKKFRWDESANLFAKMFTRKPENMSITTQTTSIYPANTIV
jgi:glycosyltransferase involved in cell wall biosynthesis/O-antigen/teichoic acid export membrane protein